MAKSTSTKIHNVTIACILLMGHVIDQAGNIWSVNNWKPDIDIDFGGNPGGDGIIIFVGLAPPLTTQVH